MSGEQLELPEELTAPITDAARSAKPMWDWQAELIAKTAKEVPDAEPDSD